MRSRTILHGLLPALLLCACLLPWRAGAQAAEPAGAPTRQQVDDALKTLRTDPDLPGSRKEKTLRFKDKQEERKKNPPAVPPWWQGFARWVTETGRVVAWAVAVLAVAVLAVSLRHWIQARAAGSPKRRAARLPSHVRDLDIRPESLPGNIGAAARELWQRGEHRPALSLLYRGALSRLVHDHGLPIRAASTEGECVILAAQRLPAAPSAFFGRLVQAWQLAVYGARLPESAQVLALCAEFDTHLQGVPAARQQAAS